MFKFLRNFIQFFQILTLFFVLMLLLYWMQDLIHQSWSWFGFFVPLMDSLLDLASVFTPLKFPGALLILFVFYYLGKPLTALINGLEITYTGGKNLIKRIEETSLNKTLSEQEKETQKKIQQYQIYVKTSAKVKFANVNLEEQNKIMNKFLIEKTGVNPEIFEDGFLYKFNKFDNIDPVLESFFKLIKSNAPLDYVICVQILDSLYDIKTLINLNIVNKISTMADTAYRYKFNTSHRYGTGQLGLFQKNGSTFEVHEFEEI